MKPIKVNFRKNDTIFYHKVENNEAKITAATDSGYWVYYTVFKDENNKYNAKNDYDETYASPNLLKAIIAKGKEVLEKGI